VGAGYFGERYAELGGTVAPGGELEATARSIVGLVPADPIATQVLDEWVTRLGAGVADLVNLFNPERIIIGGWLGRLLAADHLDAIRAATARRALAMPLSHTEILAGELGPDAGALGAATIPIQRLLAGGALRATAGGRRPTVRS
jgi:predicted NBD/HSP70 family sugar kinase